LIEERSSAYGVNVETQALEKLPLQVSGGERSLYSFLNTVPGVSNAGFANNIMGGVGLKQVVYDGVTAVQPAVQRVIAPQWKPSLIQGGQQRRGVGADRRRIHVVYQQVRYESIPRVVHFAEQPWRQDLFAPITHREAERVRDNRRRPGHHSVYNGRNKTFFFATFTNSFSTPFCLVVTCPPQHSGRRLLAAAG
jgi:hypothetical protein